MDEQHWYLEQDYKTGMKSLLLQYLKERYQRVSAKDLIQHHAEILAGKTTLDAHTQSYIRLSFGIDAGGKDQMAYETL